MDNTNFYSNATGAVSRSLKSLSDKLRYEGSSSSGYQFIQMYKFYGKFAGKRLKIKIKRILDTTFVRVLHRYLFRPLED